MKSLILIFILISILKADKLILDSGFVAAHTEVYPSEYINPLSPIIHADVSYEGSPETLKGDFQVELSVFVSEHEYRDDSMHKVLNTSEFPRASFHILSLDKSEDSGYELKGLMHLRGVKRKVVFDVYIDETDKTFKLSGRGMIMMSDFKIEPPSFLFLEIRDQVDLYIQASFLK